MSRFDDLPLETRRSAYLRFDRKAGKPYMVIDGEKRYLDALEAGEIALEAVRTMQAMACRGKR
jgi:hypothetical protein